jgi:hypothetical protein
MKTYTEEEVARMVRVVMEDVATMSGGLHPEILHYHFSSIFGRRIVDWNLSRLRRTPRTNRYWHHFHEMKSYFKLIDGILYAAPVEGIGGTDRGQAYKVTDVKPEHRKKIDEIRKYLSIRD